jgi:hypothetical protein
VTPPYKAQFCSEGLSPQSARCAEVASGHCGAPSPTGCFGYLPEHNEQEHTKPQWSEQARAFYKIDSGYRRADKRDVKGPFQEEPRLVAARLHHASSELQLRIESRRFGGRYVGT